MCYRRDALTCTARAGGSTRDHPLGCQPGRRQRASGGNPPVVSKHTPQSLLLPARGGRDRVAGGLAQDAPGDEVFQVPQRAPGAHGTRPGWSWEISTASQRRMRCLPTNSPLLGDLVSSHAHAGQHHPLPARHRDPTPALELPAPWSPQTCR